LRVHCTLAASQIKHANSERGRQKRHPQNAFILWPWCTEGIKVYFIKRTGLWNYTWCLCTGQKCHIRITEWASCDCDFWCKNRTHLKSSRDDTQRTSSLQGCADYENHCTTRDIRTTHCVAASLSVSYFRYTQITRRKICGTSKYGQFEFHLSLSHFDDKKRCSGKNINTIETIMKYCACTEINYRGHMLYKEIAFLTAGEIKHSAFTDTISAHITTKQQD
jgi:hypothetical protein